MSTTPPRTHARAIRATCRLWSAEGSGWQGTGQDVIEEAGLCDTRMNPRGGCPISGRAQDFVGFVVSAGFIGFRVCSLLQQVLGPAIDGRMLVSADCSGLICYSATTLATDPEPQPYQSIMWRLAPEPETYQSIICWPAPGPEPYQSIICCPAPGPEAYQSIFLRLVPAPNHINL